MSVVFIEGVAGPRRLRAQDVLARADIVRGQTPAGARRALGRRDADRHELRPVAVIDATQPVEVGGIEAEQGHDAARDRGTVRDNDE